MPVKITAQVTPNPDTLKFVVSIPLLESGAIEFSTAEMAKTSPLAAALFDLDGVVKVFTGTNFISVTKSTSVDWLDLAEPVSTTLEACLSSEGPYVDASLVATESSSSTDSDVVKRIKEILDNEIRPAVSMDGGDVVFERFEEGILYLNLQGACSSCPSSTLTLKMGIENRLKEDIPELQEVVQSM